MFHGKVEVFSEGVEEGEVGFCVVSISEGSTAIVDKVPLWNSFIKVSYELKIYKFG